MTDENRRHSLRPLVRPAAITLLFIALFHMLYGSVFIFRDAFWYFAPAKHVLFDMLRQGRFFEWYPWQFLGYPLAADLQIGAFYPFNVLGLALPFPDAFRLLIFIHYPLAAMFMDKFLRGRGVDHRAALMGGLAYALSGHAIYMQGYFAMLVGMTWAPLALHFSLAAMESRGPASWKRAAWAGACLALPVLAGDQQNALITACIIAMAGMAKSLMPGSKARPLAIVAAIGLASLMLAAVQLAPTIELLLHSQRGAAISFTDATYFSFHPGRLIELVWPNPFMVTGAEPRYWANVFCEEVGGRIIMPYAPGSYLGLTMMVLALAGAVKGRRALALPAAAAAMLFLLLALGRHAGLFRVFHSYVPFFDYFRYPEKYMAWFSGAVVVLAALGADALFGRAREHPRLVLYIGLGLLGFLVVAMAASWLAWPRVLSQYMAADADAALIQAARRHLLAGGIGVAVFGAGFGALLLLAGGNRVRGVTALWLVIALLTMDYYLSNVRNMIIAPLDAFQADSPVAEAIEKDGGGELGKGRVYWEDIRIPAMGGTSVFLRHFLWHRLAAAPNMGDMFGLEDLSGYNPLVPVEGLEAITSELSKKMLETYNVRYLVHMNDTGTREGPGTSLLLFDTYIGVSVTRLGNALPRAYLVPRAVCAADQDQAVEMLKRTDPREAVIITCAPGRELGEDAGAAMRPARVIEYTPDRVVVETDADLPGWLVLSDRHYPGWTARVDGVEARIEKANVMVRAVRVDAGRHRVEFSFKSMPLRAGGAVSAVGWLLAVLLAVFASARKRRG